MSEDGVDSVQAIQEQLQEQRLALQEIEAALEHVEDAELMQVVRSSGNITRSAFNNNFFRIAKHGLGDT